MPRRTGFSSRNRRMLICSFAMSSWSPNQTSLLLRLNRPGSGLHSSTTTACLRSLVNDVDDRRPEPAATSSSMTAAVSSRGVWMAKCSGPRCVWMVKCSVRDAPKE